MPTPRKIAVVVGWAGLRSGHADSTENRDPNKKPDKDAPADGFTDKSSIGVSSKGEDGIAIRAQASFVDFSTLENVVVVEVVDAVGPRQGTGEAFLKVSHDPV